MRKKWRPIDTRLGHTAGNTMVIAMLTPKPPVLPPSPSTSLSPTPPGGSATPSGAAGGSAAPSAGLSPPAGVAATNTPTTEQPGSTVAPLSPMSDSLPSDFATGGSSD